MLRGSHLSLTVTGLRVDVNMHFENVMPEKKNKEILFFEGRGEKFSLPEMIRSDKSKG